MTLDQLAHLYPELDGGRRPMTKEEQELYDWVETVCPNCVGTGYIKTHDVTCVLCKGTGEYDPKPLERGIKAFLGLG